MASELLSQRRRILQLGHTRRSQGITFPNSLLNYLKQSGYILPQEVNVELVDSAEDYFTIRLINIPSSVN